MSSGVRITNADGFAASRDRVDAIARAAVAEVAAAGHKRIISEYRDGTTADGHKGRNDTGTTWKAVRALPPERTPTGWRSVVTVQPPQDKVAIVVEEGRRPGFGISPEGMTNLRRWVGRKIRNKVLSRAKGARITTANARTGKVTGVKAEDAEDAIDQATFLIARKIRRKGIAALHPFRKAADALRGPGAQAIYARVAARFRGGR